MDGLYASIKEISWRNDSAKYIFHICDAPPHGHQYSKVRNDAYPSGCPCGLDINIISQQLKKHKISYKLLKYGSFVNKMVNVFQREISDFEKIEIDDALELADRITDTVIRDIVNQELDVLIN
jgi:hypothetical protein